jgi:dihydrofolate synthase/folylpolyglutamate synthase
VGVFAIMADKAVDEMIAALAPLVDTVVCTQASEARSLTAALLAGRVEQSDRVGQSGRVGGPASGGRVVLQEPDPHAAVALARRLAGPRGSVLVTGSLYLLSDLADLLEGGRAGNGGVY